MLLASQEPAQEASEQESESEEEFSGVDDELDQTKDDVDGEDEEDGDGGDLDGSFGGVAAMGSLLSWAGKETKSKTRGIRRDDSPIEVISNGE